MDLLDCSGFWVWTVPRNILYDCASLALSAPAYETVWNAPVHELELTAAEYETTWEVCP